ncbi:DUF899 family protein [Kineococcus terrestris]|uniref:DUF899 family protein n=1 Tax=Kineococcus terrestris TaxID=2044856 RepID=UPI0034DAC766
MAVRLPLEPVTATAAPPVVDRDAWPAACEELLVGPDGPVPFLEVFEGRRQLLAYFLVRHDGQPPEGQCEGCTFFVAGVQRPEHLHSRAATAAVLRRLDRTAYGRQEEREDSPPGWPQPFDVRGGQFRTAGRPTVQWAFTDVPVGAGSDEHCTGHR